MMEPLVYIDSLDPLQESLLSYVGMIYVIMINYDFCLFFNV